MGLGLNSADGDTVFENSAQLNGTRDQDKTSNSKDGIGVPDFHSSGIDDKRPWGLLESQYFYYKTVELAEDSFSFGRTHNQHLMYLDYMPKSCHFDNISRKHFTIKKDGDKVTITDHSHWGTFIKNSKTKKIGNGKVAVLENDDEIRINRPDHLSYKFKLLRLH